MSKPETTFSLVSVICISHNHERYVEDALDSILHQRYPNIEIIILDDCSSDCSVLRIKEWIKRNKKNCIFIQNKQRLGVTKSFNKAFEESTGDYIVDLAADDILLPNFVSKHIFNFQNTTYANPGISYCNVELVTENLRHIHNHHFERSKKKLIRNPIEGVIYKEIVRTSFINPISLLSKREVYTKLNGYDENLIFEDLDYWIRAAREFEFIYVDEVLARKRVLSYSLTTSIKKNTPFRKEMQRSFVLVCEKTFALNKTNEEHRALLARILLCAKWFIKNGNVEAVGRLLQLYLKVCHQLISSFFKISRIKVVKE